MWVKFTCKILCIIHTCKLFVNNYLCGEIVRQKNNRIVVFLNPVI